MWGECSPWVSSNYAISFNQWFHILTQFYEPNAHGYVFITIRKVMCTNTSIYLNVYNGNGGTHTVGTYGYITIGF